MIEIQGKRDVNVYQKQTAACWAAGVKTRVRD